MRLLIKVSGAVQGVGFRPFVYGLASSLGLRGHVANTPEGVAIDVEGESLDDFIKRLKEEAPPLSKILSVDISPLPLGGSVDFRILESAQGGGFTLVSPDAATCPHCLRELADSRDRRYLYPFINCTGCGPRYSITKRIPYDRANTTMAAFKMCPACEGEYKDPSDRRFHAEPNACPDCGPKVILRQAQDGLKISEKVIASSEKQSRHLEIASPPARNDGNNDIIKSDDIVKTVELLKGGSVVAIKGLGGFHLACDATNEDAVRRLRERKRKNNKPFALMAADLETIKRYCHVSPEEEALLTSKKRPIVLLRRNIVLQDRVPPALSDSVSLRGRRLGFMLPYTPLHYLLFNNFTSPPLSKGGMGGFESGVQRDGVPLRGGGGGATALSVLVLTSGNLSEEPIVTDGGEAIKKLGGIADAFLDHDREIFMRVDDSVVKSVRPGLGGIVRRARGYAPEPMALPLDGPDALSVGADMKNTFTLLKGPYAIVSQHIGDMDNFETAGFFEETLEGLSAVFGVRPVAIAHDLHPGYGSTKWALKYADEQKIKGSIYPCQHHHAHIASVMAEKGLRGKVIGAALDGTGYGGDGTLWGGEFLIADAREFKRAGHFRHVPLPGGEAAIREPFRCAASYIESFAGNEAGEYLRRLGFFERHGETVIRDVLAILQIREFSPLSSGAGRLFDAVSSILGICDINTFEGEAAMALEAVAAEDVAGDYPSDVISKDPMEVDFSYALMGIVEDLLSGTARDVIAAKFQNTVAEAVSRVVRRLSMLTGIEDVVLSGGVFQNDYLLSAAKDKLEADGLRVYSNELVPSNDGGISLGQAYILRARLAGGGGGCR